MTNCTEPSTRPRIRKGTRSSFYRKLSWDMETLMSRLELHKWWSLDPDHKYVLLRPHQNGSAFKVLRSVGVSELLVMIKLRAFRSVFSSNRLLLQQPELRTGGWHLSADGFSGVWCQTLERRKHCWKFATGHIVAVWSIKFPLITQYFLDWRLYNKDCHVRLAGDNAREIVSGKQLELWMWKGWSC